MFLMCVCVCVCVWHVVNHSRGCFLKDYKTEIKEATGTEALKDLVPKGTTALEAMKKKPDSADDAMKKAVSVF